MTDEQVVAYLRSLKPGERVIETGQCGYYGMLGVVYVSENEGTKGSICVRWDNKMGTSATWGTRRLEDKGDTKPREIKHD